MLQNPSKYHPNPLSHFLALHSTQAAHNARNNGNANGISSNASHILTNVSAFGLGGDQQRHGSFQHQQQQQQQHQLHQHQQHTLLVAAQQHQQQQQQQHETTHTSIQHNLSTTTHAHQHAQFLDATGTTLDVGKSFTIAAILGLQSRNGMEHSHRKDYNSVINLSLNGNGSGGGGGVGIGGNGNQLKKQCGTPPMSADELSKMCGEKITSKHENTDELHDRNGNQRQCNASDNNKIHCDNNNLLVNPYLPITTTTTTATTSVNGNTNVFMAASTAQHSHHQQFQHHQQQQQQQQQQQHQHTNHHHHLNHHPLMSTHARANSFAAAAAVAAVNAVVNGTPTALQSLQQLHQHHAQQTSLNFSREKLKSDNHHTKKSSLKNKRVRTIFTPEQLERLEAEFERQQYMVGPERLYLAHTLQLTEAQVKVWFQNRRIKWRKHHLELTQQRLALLRQNQLPVANAPQAISSLPSPDGLATAASNSSFDENDEPNIKSEQEHLTNSQKSHTESDSELSICNDSMDADSTNDGGGDT